jgi:pre-mRNA-splicing factor CWC22
MSWAVLQVIKTNEDDTTSSSRTFVKIMMQEETVSMGLPTLKERFADAEIKALCTGMFPLDNPETHGSLSITLRVSDLVPLRKICASISR